MQHSHSVDTLMHHILTNQPSDILVADLCRRIGHFDESKRWISSVLTSRGANERIKNKARDLKDMVEKDVERLSKVKH